MNRIETVALACALTLPALVAASQLIGNLVRATSADRERRTLARMELPWTLTALVSIGVAAVLAYGTGRA